jgi:hypothetical protein
MTISLNQGSYVSGIIDAVCAESHLFPAPYYDEARNAGYFGTKRRLILCVN